MINNLDRIILKYIVIKHEKEYAYILNKPHTYPVVFSGIRNCENQIRKFTLSIVIKSGF